MGIGGFAAMRALSQRNDEPARASRPWDSDRDGFVVGEGAGILILEELRDMRGGAARTILAEIVGYGMSGDAFHITSPSEDGDGAYRVMRNALKDAGPRAASDRLHQCARHLHAAGRPRGDHGHQARLRRTRPQSGGQLHQIHDRASAGRRGRSWKRASACWRFATRSRRPPSIYETPDPECDLDYVPNHARPMHIEYVLTNSFGFGGTNGCLIFKKVQSVGRDLSL